MLLYCIFQSGVFTKSRENIFTTCIWGISRYLEMMKRNSMKESPKKKGNKNILPGYRNGIWHWIMFHADRKSGKREKTEAIELSNQGSIRTLGEKNNGKSLGIFSTNTIKQWLNKKKEEITEKIKNNSWNEALQQTSHQMNKQLGFPLYKRVSTILKLSFGSFFWYTIRKKGSKEQENRWMSTRR